MKKMILALMILAVGLLFVNVEARAYSISVGDQIVLTQGVGGANNGGSFNVDKVGDDQGILFSTFCLERNEYITLGAKYYVGSISDGAIAGGYSGGNPDPISSKTAYLFYQWATGLIAHTRENANDLQLAIWSLEGEITDAHFLAMTTGANALIESANNANGLYGVQVMNLYGDAKYNSLKQSQLIYIPEPADLFLLGISLVGIAIAIRKFGKVQA